MLRILIVDDHDVVRRGLHAQLSRHEHWTICGEARNGREAVRLALQLKPDLVVMDLSMPELNGLEATRQIRRQLSRTEILIFTAHDSDELIREALSAGARGYLLKSDAECHLIDAVATLAHHKPYFTTRVAEKLRDSFVYSNATTTVGQILTAREREIVQMLAEGKSNKEIAGRLQISVKTVETHRSSVMRKLDINSVVALVHYAIRNQIVEA